MSTIAKVNSKASIHVKPGAFNPIYYRELLNQTRLQIIFGGASSGKSYFMGQRIVIDCLAGRNWLVLRNVAQTLRASVWNETVKAISLMNLKPWFDVNKTNFTITARNNKCQIMFAGLNDVEKIKSITPGKGVLTDIWIEEATEISYDDYKQLSKRLRGMSKKSKRITLTFNPIYKEHWIYTEFFGRWDDTKTQYQDDDITILKTTYKDNEFLTPGDVHALENETDEYYHNVYTLGNWGVLGDVIFRNWEMRDLREEKLIADKLFLGLDFGFSSDPAAAVKASYHRATRTIYILEEFYERGLTNTHLAKLMTEFTGSHYIVCDSSEPKSIKELQNLGVKAMGAKKGPDSVIHGIQWLQGCRIVVDTSCQRMKNELTLYQWRKDKDGNSMRVPVDQNNHLIDALRYAMEIEATARYAGTLELKL